MKTLFRVLLGLVPAVYLTLLGTGNRAEVPLNLVFRETHQPLGLIVLGALLIGVGITALAFTWPIVRVRMRLRRESRRVALLEQEVHGLRTLPLSEDDEAKAVEAREG